MGASLTSGQCQQYFDTDECSDGRIRNAGTEWEPIHSVNCPGCNEEVRFKVGTGRGWQLDEVIDREPAPVTTHRVPIAERVKKYDVPEWWVQRNIKTRGKSGDIKLPDF